jgi:hypothetical protein
MPGSATRERVKARAELDIAHRKLIALEAKLDKGLSLNEVETNLGIIEMHLKIAQVHATLAVSAEYPAI